MSDEKLNLLKKLRGEVNDLDKRIVDLLDKRFANSKEIGRLKRDLGKLLHSPERELEIFNNILNTDTKNISKESLQNIYRIILNESLGVQEKEKQEPSE